MTVSAKQFADRMEFMRKLEQWAKERMGKIKYKIAVMSGKGGVGKTTVSVNLAYALAMRNYKVGILDADIYGPDIPIALRIEDKVPKVSGEAILPFEGPLGIKVMSIQFLLPEEDAPIVWMGPLVSKAIQQFVAQVEWGELDFLVIDLPPGTGDEALAVAKNVPGLTGIVVVVTPQKIALHDAKKALGMAKIIKVPVLGIIENMRGFRCPHCGGITYIFGKGGGEDTAKTLGVPFLGDLPLDPRVVEFTDQGMPFIAANPDSEISKKFNVVVDNLLKELDKLGSSENK